MELANIESLLEAYFDGNTSLAEEATLQNYFLSANVAPHLAPYKSLFESLAISRQEVSKREFTIPEASNSSRGWWLSIAASVVIAIGVAGFVFSNSGMSQEEEDALMAFNQTKETMMMLSSSINKGTEPMYLLSENLNKGTSALVALNQFTVTTNKVLK